MNQKKNKRKRNPQQAGGGMPGAVRANVEMLSSVSESDKCGKKDYERLFIRVIY